MSNGMSIETVEMTPKKLQKYLAEIVKRNMELEDKLSICIWGKPGVGKTALVEGLTIDGKPIKVINLLLSQTDDKGDLTGIPRTMMVKRTYKDENDNLIEKEEPVTKYAIPSWVPTEEGPGIIFLDDWTRSSLHITQAVMQFIQKQKMMDGAAYTLPKGWTIVLAANPDNGDEDTIQLDFAKITRMGHVWCEPSVTDWCDWALEKKFDPNIVNFIANNPQYILGNVALREQNNDVITNYACPRTIEYFANAVGSIKLIESKNFEDISRNDHLVGEELVRVSEYAFMFCGKVFKNDLVTFITQNKFEVPKFSVLFSNEVKTDEFIDSFKSSLINGDKVKDSAMMITLKILQIWLVENFPAASKDNKKHKSISDKIIALLEAKLNDNSFIKKDMIISFIKKIQENTTNPNLNKYFVNNDSILLIQSRAIKNK